MKTGPEMEAGGQEDASVHKSLSRRTLEALEYLPLACWSPVQRRVEFEGHQTYMTASVVDGFKTLIQVLRKDLASHIGYGGFEPVILENGVLLNNTMASLPPDWIDSQFEVVLEKVTPVAPETTQILSPYRLKVAIPSRGSLPGTVQVEADGHDMVESFWEVLEREISGRAETDKRGEGSIAINALVEALDPSPSQE